METGRRRRWSEDDKLKNHFRRHLPLVTGSLGDDLRIGAWRSAFKSGDQDATQTLAVPLSLRDESISIRG